MVPTALGISNRRFDTIFSIEIEQDAINMVVDGLLDDSITCQITKGPTVRCAVLNELKR